MKTTLLAAAAVLAATPALASETLFCQLDDVGGNLLGYFLQVGPTAFIETAVLKNGNRIVHPPGQRPRWPATGMTQNGIYTLTYAPDPKFKMVINARHPVLSPEGVRLFPVQLGADGDRRARAKGSCAWADEVLPDGRPYE